MKYFKLKTFLFFFFFLTNSHASNNVAFIDIDYLINNSTFGKNIITKIEKEDKKNVEKLKNKESDLKKIEDEIKKKKNIISKAELEKEIDLLKQKISKFKSDKNIMVKNFTKFKNDELNKILKEFNKIIQQYMEKNSIDIVFDKKNIYIGKGSIDITPDVLDVIENTLK